MEIHRLYEQAVQVEAIASVTLMRLLSNLKQVGKKISLRQRAFHEQGDSDGMIFDLALLCGTVTVGL